jgi:hypothetical protein
LSPCLSTDAFAVLFKMSIINLNIVENVLDVRVGVQPEHANYLVLAHLEAREVASQMTGNGI